MRVLVGFCVCFHPATSRFEAKLLSMRLYRSSLTRAPAIHIPIRIIWQSSGRGKNRFFLPSSSFYLYHFTNLVLTRAHRTPAQRVATARPYIQMRRRASCAHARTQVHPDSDHMDANTPKRTPIKVSQRHCRTAHCVSHCTLS